MLNFSKKDHGEVVVHSKVGPIRIELLDDQLNRLAHGFGELKASVPAGLYTLQYSACMVQEEEIVRVKPGQIVTRTIAPRFYCVAPVSVSATTHEFHSGPAQQYSQQLMQNYGVGGGLMVFVRTIDADGRAPVPIERFSLRDAQMHLVCDLVADAKQGDKEGWSCLSAQVNPGGYALRWHTPETTKPSRHGGGAGLWSVDQPLWVSHGWVTMVLIGYLSESDQFERQSTQIHMARLGAGFQPGPSIEEILGDHATEEELKEARINQSLSLVLAGLRSGNQVVPDDLLSLLLGGRFQNPMLGIVSAYAILHQHRPDWNLFDLVVQKIESLLPDHTEVAALRLCGNLLRKQEGTACVMPLAWPPMMSAGYKGLIEGDWKASGTLIVDGSMAERAAVLLLPESPWTCWRVLSEIPDLPTKRVCHQISKLEEMGEEVDLSNLSLDHFQQLGLPIASVKKMIQRLMDTSDRQAAP